MYVRYGFRHKLTDLTPSLLLVSSETHFVDLIKHFKKYQ